MTPIGGCRVGLLGGKFELAILFAYSRFMLSLQQLLNAASAASDLADLPRLRMLTRFPRTRIEANRCLLHS